MLDQTFRRLIDPPLNMIAAALAPHISANMLTLIGFILALLCFGALAAGAYMGALALLLCNRLLDGLDGPVARHSARGATDFGGYIDIVTDFIFYGGFV
ncbi:MAG: CDP-alcohol phosphatidyltransferase family protein, partial [Alphaproteobacteria bacterium]|nr:CDP-alcohol phosphatidyltransferase family protein [Alphaproteobacteria bacterium]